MDFGGENKFQETTVISQHFDEDVLKEINIKESLENIVNKVGTCTCTFKYSLFTLHHVFQFKKIKP